MAKLNWATATDAQAQKMADFLGENRAIARSKGLPTPAGNPTLVDDDKKRPR